MSRKTDGADLKIGHYIYPSEKSQGSLRKAAGRRGLSLRYVEPFATGTF